MEAEQKEDKSISLHHLVKIFDQEEHADAFLRGEIYAQKLQAFRDHEEKGRKDETAGTVQSFPPKGIRLTISPVKGPYAGETILTEKDLTSPVRWLDNDALNLNVFCMFGIYGGTPELEILLEHQRLDLPDRCAYEFGAHIAYIENVRQFLDRVQDAAKREGYPLSFRPVMYYDPSVLQQSLHPVFSKPEDAAYQREFRLAFERKEPGPLKLNVGDLQDIVVKGEILLESECYQ